MRSAAYVAAIWKLEEHLYVTQRNPWEKMPTVGQTVRATLALVPYHRPGTVDHQPPDRWGHIELVAPIVHIWYLKGIPSYIGLTLDMSVKDIERIVYFEAYMVLKQGASPYPIKTVLSPKDVQVYKEKAPLDVEFVVGTGAEAIRNILSTINLDLEISILEENLKKTSSVISKAKIMKRLKVLGGMRSSNIRPEWMVLTAMPVLPPDLRPLVQIDGGRFASSDLNELYSQISDKKKEIGDIESQISKYQSAIRDKQNQKSSLSNQVSITSQILKNHTYWSLGFSKIESALQNNVQFKSLSATLGEGILNIRALSDNYTTIAKQLAAFVADDSIKDMTLDGVNTLTSGKLDFNTKIGFDKAKFLLKNQ